MSALPSLDPAAIASLTQFRLADPGKREWETSRTGYLNWAVGQLLERARRMEEEEESGKEGGEGRRDSALDAMAARAGEVGRAEDLKRALEATESVRDSLKNVGNISVIEDDSMAVDDDR